MNNGAVLPAILFTGRFGSGKTETAINYARALVQGSAPGIDFEPTDGQPGGLSEVVVLVDLDIVTPYFRSREMAARMAEQGVRVVAPSIVGQHLAALRDLGWNAKVRPLRGQAGSFVARRRLCRSGE